VCVDLDGTLVAGDLLWEAFVDLLIRRPFRALWLLAGAWRGKARFKRQIAREVPLDPAALSYREDLLSELRDLHARGACLVLATASDEGYARAVASHLGIFADVVASDGRSNLAGSEKATALVQRFGDGGFDYYGNGWSDVPVWQRASEAIAIGASPRLVRFVTAGRLVEDIRGTQPAALRSVIKALRPHQWVKNLLVFVPLGASHSFMRFDLWALSAMTFVVFSMGASAIYVLNDISDIRADRRHPRKRRRPFAAGALGIPAGLAVAATLLIAASSLALVALPWTVAAILMAYVATTTLYSVSLKRKPVADVFTLTGLYVLRIVAGGVATGIALSSWLLAFALFFFLSLAFVKRYAEVLTADGWIAGRGYCRDDLLWMHAIGTTAGYMAVLVLALYVNAPEVAVLYTRPTVLWLICPVLLFWITRLWFRAGRRLIHDDPVVEALRDSRSYLMVGAALGIMLAAI
jgi:4-hydroxybenzoate polyprenyltransferase